MDEFKLVDMPPPAAGAEPAAAAPAPAPPTRVACRDLEAQPTAFVGEKELAGGALVRTFIAFSAKHSHREVRVAFAHRAAGRVAVRARIDVRSAARSEFSRARAGTACYTFFVDPLPEDVPDDGVVEWLCEKTPLKWRMTDWKTPCDCVGFATLHARHCDEIEFDVDVEDAAAPPPLRAAHLLRDARENAALCDIEVRARDGGAARAHRAVLAAASPVWARMLSGEWDGAARATFDAAECADAAAAEARARVPRPRLSRADSFFDLPQDLVRLAYGEAAPAAWARAAGVLEAAQVWLPPEAARAVEDALVADIARCPGSAVDAYTLGARAGLGRLRDAARGRVLREWRAAPERRDAINAALEHAPELRKEVFDMAARLLDAGDADDAGRAGVGAGAAPDARRPARSPPKRPRPEVEELDDDDSDDLLDEYSEDDDPSLDEDE